MKFYTVPLRLFCVLLLFLSLETIFASQAHAATLTNASNRLTTSRPSASAPLQAAQAASATQVTVVDNGSVFLASDSAILRADTGETQNTVTVASMSAASGGNRTVTFTSTAANTHHAGDPIVVPITAMHSISFINPSIIPDGGFIILTFPALTTGDANNEASPSATTFQMNNLDAAETTSIKVLDDDTEITPLMEAVNPSNGTSPTITFTLNDGAIAAGSVIEIFIGCTAVSGGICSASSPIVINPTTAGVTAGTARIWQLGIQTQNASSLNLDSTNVRIATVDSVLVQGTVDPTFTVTIAGLADAANFNSSSTGCASEVSNAGIAATATVVNLGVLSSGVLSKAGQTITVSTNSSFGYAITATSSGRFLDPGSGNYILDVNGGAGLTANDTPAPAAFPATGNAAFGIAPCGTRVPTSSPDWDDESALAFGSGGKASNPWNTGANYYYATIASYTAPVSAEVTVIRYAATVGATTPAGLYRNIFTYVVTPTF